MPPLPGTQPTPPGSAQPPVSGAGTKYSYGNIEWLWIKNGGARWLAPIMAAIAMAESGGNWFNLNNNPKTGDYSVGLWQINYFGSLLGPRTKSFGSPAQLRANPDLQAKAAIAISGGAANSSLSKTQILANLRNNWTTYGGSRYQSALKSGAGVQPENPGVGAGGQLSPGNIAGSIADALLPNWLSGHNIVRFGQGVMGFGLIILGIILVTKEPATKAAVKVATTASGEGEFVGAARKIRNPRVPKNPPKSKEGPVDTGTETVKGVMGKKDKFDWDKEPDVTSYEKPHNGSPIPY